MLVLTIQRKEILEKILNKTYHVNLWQSPFAYQSIRFTEGYNIILNKLQDKAGVPLLEGESCFWGWVKNPYIDFFAYDKDKYVALFVDIPKSQLVLSDYDKYTDYVLENSYDNDFILDSSKPLPECVQCSFLHLKPENIKLTVPLDMLNKDSKSVTEMYHLVSYRCIWFYFSSADLLAHA